MALPVLVSDGRPQDLAVHHPVKGLTSGFSLPSLELAGQQPSSSSMFHDAPRRSAPKPQQQQQQPHPVLEASKSVGQMPSVNIKASSWVADPLHPQRHPCIHPHIDDESVRRNSVLQRHLSVDRVAPALSQRPRSASAPKLMHHARAAAADLAAAARPRPPAALPHDPLLESKLPLSSEALQLPAALSVPSRLPQRLLPALCPLSPPRAHRVAPDGVGVAAEASAGSLSERLVLEKLAGRHGSFDLPERSTQCSFRALQPLLALPCNS